MRFVPTKTPEQQSGLVLHRTRHLFIRQQTSVINAIRAHCAEFGIIAPVGRQGVEELLNVIVNANDKQVPEIARACLLALGIQLRRIKEQILKFDRMIRAWHRSCETSRRLDEIPGVGPALATALVASIATQGHSDQGETSRPGSGWCRSRARAEASQDSVASANRAIVIYVACSQRVHSQSFAMPRSTVSDTDRGSPHC